MSDLFITYSAECAEDGHVDPNFTQLVYGNSSKNGNIVKKLEPGSFIFFNANINGARYITAYFYVEKVLLKGKDDAEIDTLNCGAKYDEVIIIGSRNFSKILTIPLLFDKQLMLQMPSFKADEAYFESKPTPLAAIGHRTYNPTWITNEEKEMLISMCKNRG